MTHITDDERGAGRCEGCGNIYTVRISPDGGVEPIGVSAGCTQCGGTEFAVLGGADGPSSTP